MRDPQEGLTADGMIRTGVRRTVAEPFAGLVADVIDEFDRARAPGGELHLYGSVATGQARPGESDVDLMVIDGAPEWATDVSARLSERYAELCRGVEIAVARTSDFTGPGDEAYGNRVFLRHYCVHLAGADTVRERVPFRGDVRAARGFNGDIQTYLERWRAGDADARRVARKTLVAAAGLVSVRQRTWTTDRGTAARVWAQQNPGRTDAVGRLSAWADGTLAAAPGELETALAPDGVVSEIAGSFAAEIGLWSDAR